MLCGKNSQNVLKQEWLSVKGIHIDYQNIHNWQKIDFLSFDNDIELPWPWSSDNLDP